MSIPTKIPKVRLKASEKPKKKVRKSDSTEYDNRIFTIIQLLMRGLQRKEVIQYIADKTDWNIQERMVDKYLRVARDEIKAQSETDKAYYLGESLLRLRNLYFKLYNLQDFKGALQVQKEINDLMGIKEPIKTTNENISKITIVDETD